MVIRGEKVRNEKWEGKNLKERERERHKLIKNLCIGKWYQPQWHFA